jgi:hypothetical protein
MHGKRASDVNARARLMGWIGRVESRTIGSIGGGA